MAYEGQPVERKSLAPLVSPDQCPSSSAMFIEDRGKDVIWAFQVKGLGVIVLRATSDVHDPKGRMVFVGMSEFSKDEIGSDRV